jgi:hypothetical protein
MRRGDDLDLIAVLQLGAQRHEVAIHTARHAAIADVGMHGVGEVHRVEPRGSDRILPCGVNT